MFPRIFIDFLTKKIKPESQEFQSATASSSILALELRRILEKNFYQFFCSPPLWIKVENIFLFRR